MTSARRRWLSSCACATLVACARPQPVEVESAGPDPSAKPTIPIATPAPIASSAPAPSPLPAPDALGEQACEPVVRCGFWSSCVWLRRVDALHVRAIGGDAAKGEIFVRRRDCHPADAGPSGCAVYCKGADGGPPCVDGLHPEHETCTASAPPTPNSQSCAFGAGICGSLM